MENKFEIGDLVRIKNGLTEDETGISIEELKTMDYFNEIILMPRMMPIKTKIKPDYEIEWDMDKSIINVPKLSKEKANIFNLK